MEIRSLAAADLDELREIDGTVESADYLHIEQTGQGLDAGWKLEKRPLRQKLIAANPLSDEAQFLAKQIATGIDEGLALFAEHQDQPAGLLLAQPRHEHGTLEVVDFRVDSDFRRQGIASAMIFQTIQRARELELRAVLCVTRANNLPANQFLLKNSFELTGLDTRRSTNHDLVKEMVSLLWYASLD